MAIIPFCARPVKRPDRLARRAPAAVLLCLALSPAPAGAEDPFRTSELRPAKPSGFWEGPGGPDPCPDLAAPPDPLRLLDSIDLALCHNPRTRQSWASAKVSAAQVGVARSSFLPEVGATVSAQRIEQRNTNLATPGLTQLNGTLSLSYLLFDFGGRDARLEQARETLLASDWTHNATLQQVMLDAVQFHYQLYAAREAVDAAVAAEKAALTSLEAARARQKAGTATRADVLQAQTAYSQAQLNRTQAEGTAANAQGQLANALGTQIDRDVRIVAPPDLEAKQVIERSVSDLLALARDKRPDLAAAEAQVRAAESNIRAQQAAGKPSISLFGNLGATENSPGVDPRTGAIGVQVNIPLFTGYRIPYQIQAAREQLEVQQATRDQLRNDVALQVWQAYQDLRTQGQSLATTTDLVRSAQESYDAALARFKAGVGTITDLLNAQSALASASVQRIQARYLWNVAKATLARAIGVLDPTLVARQEALLSAPAKQ
jgi:TolC family type I secretion outer membrane protein